MVDGAAGTEVRVEPGGARMVVVANRLPVRVTDAPGGRAIKTSPGGLVTALAPLIRERGGAWIGWTGESGEPAPPFEHEGISIRPVGLSDDDIASYYYGFSNRTLWPLYHDGVRTPSYRRSWWRRYVDCNRRFAFAAAEALRPGDMLWVHDYQLQLVPQMVRQLVPDARIGFFLHIPFPPQELFAQLPWRRQILEGILGSDVVGFQTRLGVHNFSRSVKRIVGVGGTDTALEVSGRRVTVRHFPISIDFKRFEALARRPETVARAKEVRELLGPDRRVILGVDRLDYTKGIDIRLRAFEELLLRREVTAGDAVFVQVAVPSREQDDHYASERESIERLVGRINGEHSEPGRIAVHYLYRGLPAEELIAYYLAADVLMVTPFRDGMNLVAKEYPATRSDNTGVVVLSEFAGAAHEMRGALLVNPHDIDGMAATLSVALRMPAEEAAKRMAQMRRLIRKQDVFAWADDFVRAMPDGNVGIEARGAGEVTGPARGQ